MIIERLSILDFIEFRKEIKSFFKSNKRLLNLFNLKKFSNQQKALLLCNTNRVDFETIQLNRIIWKDTDFINNTKELILESKNRYLKYLVTDDLSLSSIIKNSKSSNLILKLNSLKNIENDFINDNFEKFSINKHLDIRCVLQNDIFFDKNRIPLQNKDIIYECEKDNFIENLAFFIKKDEDYIGYGQVLLIEDKYYVANFGIKSIYRSNGYGKKLLKYILVNAKKNGIEDIYIKVEKKNEIALKLYTSLGFEFFKELNVFKIG